MQIKPKHRQRKAASGFTISTVRLLQFGIRRDGAMA